MKDIKHNAPGPAAVEAAPRSCRGAIVEGGHLTLACARRGLGGKIGFHPVSPDEARGRVPSEGGGAWVAGCTTALESLTLWVQTPFSSAAKAKKVAPSLLDVNLPFPLESCHYRIVELRRGGNGGFRALAALARDENLHARIEAYRKLRINPVLLDHEGLALWTQSLSEHPLPRDTVRIILHCGREHFTLVVGRGDLYINSHGVRAAPSAEAGDESGLADRLRRILRAEAPAAKAGCWLACGAGARTAATAAALHKQLSDEWPGPLVFHREPETFLARALAARAVAGGPLRCNLRFGALAHPALLLAVRRRALATASLFLAAGLLLCAANAGWRLMLARREAGINRSIRGLAAELAPDAKIQPGQELREARKAAGQRAEHESAFLRFLLPSPASRLAPLTEACKSRGIACETLNLRGDGFSIAGNCNDWNDCEKLADDLRALGYRITLGRREPDSAGRARFIVESDRETKP